MFTGLRNVWTFLLLFALFSCFAGTASSATRPDSETPYPETVPADCRIEGVGIEHWGYRLTSPGSPDNRMIFSVEMKNSTDKTQRGYLLAGLDYAKTAWADPGPAWYRAEIREATLEPGSKTMMELVVPDLMSIHLGLKIKSYVPRVILYPAEEIDGKEGAVDGVVLHNWNWAPVIRRVPPLKVGFIGIVQNRNSTPKRVTFSMRLTPKQGVEGYEGPAEGYTSTEMVVVPGNAFQRVHLTSVEMPAADFKRSLQILDAEFRIKKVGDVPEEMQAGKPTPQ